MKGGMEMEDIRDFGMDLKEEIMNAVPDDISVAASIA